MRDILFRGKRKGDGKWVEGYYVMVDPVDMPDRIREPKAVIFPVYATCNWFNKYFYNAVEVLPETVGQFAGLVDCYGKKIFEGDVLSITRGDVIKGVMYPNRSEIGVVEYCEGKFLMEIKHEYERREIMPLRYIEVIGNIHDDPELLEAE